MSSNDQSGFTHGTYISPFSWRYGSKEMRTIWSEEHKRRLLRRFWIALAAAQQEAGIVSKEEVDDLKAHADQIDIARASEIEAEIRHDLMAEIKTFAEQCPVGGRIIHLGATSMDALDNVEVMRQKDALSVLIRQLQALLSDLSRLISDYAHVPSMAFTHLQPAEPTTIGYRLAQYGQDLLADCCEVQRVHDMLKGKGLKGAVGTSASYGELLSDSPMSPRDLEERVMNALGLEAYEAATQVYPRKQDWLLVNSLAGISATLYKMAFDLRLLQSPPFGEWSEPFGKKQVGSSAMPFKRNPIKSENIDSLARFVASLPSIAWDNAAHCLLERTLDDSANRRIMIPEAFLAVDEMLRTAGGIFADLQIHSRAVERNLEDYGVFAATERLLMELSRKGADRQDMHEVIREHCIQAWGSLQEGSGNPLGELLSGDPRITAYLNRREVLDFLDASVYIGDASARAVHIAGIISDYLSS